MNKFIELTNAESELPILVNVDMIVAIDPYDDDEDEEPKTFVYISGDDANSLLEIAETYEEVKKKIIQACIEEEERICITHTEDGEFLRKGNKIYRRTTL